MNLDKSQTYIRIECWNVTMCCLPFRSTMCLSFRYTMFTFQKYQVRIQDVNQPLLLSKPKKKDLRRGAGDAYLIPELCIMTGLSEEMRSDFNMMKNLADYLRTAPDKRVHSIMTLSRDLIASEKVNFESLLRGTGEEKTVTCCFYTSQIL